MFVLKVSGDLNKHNTPGGGGINQKKKERGKLVVFEVGVDLLDKD
mgnify:CR=1 FL=1